jgi:threonyl-tRNA synthetase
MTKPFLLSIRQSSAEILAYAVTLLFPSTRLLTSEISEIGFTYDFLSDQPLDETVLPLIEEKMRELVKLNLPIQTIEMMRENAAVFFRHLHQPLVAQHIEESLKNIVPIFKMAEFHDYCPPPYESSSSSLGAFKLLKIERLRSHLPIIGESVITRITGTAFADLPALKAFIKRTDQAKKRDHRLLGKEMGLFSQEDAGSGEWFWHPKGACLREILLDWWREEHRKQKFQFLATPRVIKQSVLKKSGFYDVLDQQIKVFPNFSLDGVDYVLTPSLLPAHSLVFRSHLHSYRELPIRYAEYGEVYQQRKPSQLWGLLRARAYTVDVAHIFCSPSQVLEELISSLQLIGKTVKMLGFEYHWYLVSRGRKYAGTLDKWDLNLDLLIKALKACGCEYTLDAAGKAFIGPRIEVRLIDALGREWKGPFVGIDFNHPERFGLHYHGADGEMHTPTMITRSMFGSLERFVAVLVEHYAGVFPLWLAPEQVRIIPVAESHHDYADDLHAGLERAGLRSQVDYRHDKLGAKVHAAEREKVPYAVIVGDKEKKEGLITVRSCSQKIKTSQMKRESFLQNLLGEVSSKALPGKTHQEE